MTNYNNPKVMAQISKEAEKSGIFAVGKERKITTFKYRVWLNRDNVGILDMIKEDQRKYKLIQINFEMGLSAKQETLKLYINFIKDGLFKQLYEIKLSEWTDKADRAWDNVTGKPKKFIFQSKDGFIEEVNCY